jgi:uncharacterized membrane protein YcaP (DUF421 family)
VFFDGWGGVLRVIVVGLLAYAALIVLLRVSGKRTLSKLNAFDFVVTVALGSTLATVLLSKDVALVEGIVAFAVLICAQFAVTALSVRSKRVRSLVKSEPRLIAYRGKALDGALMDERITRDEIAAALRGQGYTSVEETTAVILETDGSINALKFGADDADPALAYVNGFADAQRSSTG